MTFCTSVNTYSQSSVSRMNAIHVYIYKEEQSHMVHLQETSCSPAGIAQTTKHCTGHTDFDSGG